MGWADSELDFAVVDRAQSLGELLRLLFVLAEIGASPKEVANALSAFDLRQAIDPETAGRWLRDERRPSKSHLQLLVRFLQAKRLIGSPVAKDRVFIRIAAFYAGLRGPFISMMIAPRRQPYKVGMNFRKARDEYRYALAMASDFETLDDIWYEFEALVPDRDNVASDPRVDHNLSVFIEKAREAASRSAHNEVAGVSSTSSGKTAKHSRDRTLKGRVHRDSTLSKLRAMQRVWLGLFFRSQR